MPTRDHDAVAKPYAHPSVLVNMKPTDEASIVILSSPVQPTEVRIFTARNPPLIRKFRMVAVPEIPGNFDPVSIFVFCAHGE